MTEVAHLRIVPMEGDPPQYRFEFRSPYEARPVVVNEVRSVDGIDQLVDLARDLEKTVIQRHRLSIQGVLVGEADTGDVFRRVGRLMYDHLLPEGIGHSLRRLPADTPLVLSTSDVLFPWELLHDGQDFLMLKLRMARWLMVRGGDLVASPTAETPGDRPAALLIASDPDGDLPGSQTEVEALEGLLEDHASVRMLCGPRATRALVGEALESGGHRLIHYSGHALPATEEGPGCLLLAGGERLEADRLSLSAGAPVVFLNACHSADETGPAGEPPALPLEFVYRGLASSFVEAGARAVIGTLWPVSDLGACRFAEIFYRQALAGQTLGDSLHLARRTLLHEMAGDPAWASYVFYGDPADVLFPVPELEEEAVEDLVSLREAASLLGVPYRQVYQLASQGQLRGQKVDGELRVSRQDVMVLRGSRGQGPVEVRAGDAGPACARCGRQLGEAEGQACLHPGCDASLCDRCWQAEDDRYCATHAPTPEQRLDAARARLEGGGIPVLVTAEEARQSGRGFVQRFDQRIRGQGGIPHPATGRLIRVPDWQSLRLPAREGAPGQRLGLLAGDSVSRYRLGGQPPLVIEAACVCRLEPMTGQGFDTMPLGLADLGSLLDQRLAEVGGDEMWAVGWASPTGWEDPAVAHINASEPGQGFFHNQLLVLLVDWPARRVIRNRHDDRSEALARLFVPLTVEEEMQELRQWVEDQLVTSDSISLEEVRQWADVPEDVIEQVFQEMAGDERYRLDELERVGWVVSRG